jgi:hypothetical protein
LQQLWTRIREMKKESLRQKSDRLLDEALRPVVEELNRLIALVHGTMMTTFDTHLTRAILNGARYTILWRIDHVSRQ